MYMRGLLFFSQLLLLLLLLFLLLFFFIRQIKMAVILGIKPYLLQVHLITVTAFMVMSHINNELFSKLWNSFSLTELQILHFKHRLCLESSWNTAMTTHSIVFISFEFKINIVKWNSEISKMKRWKTRLPWEFKWSFNLILFLNH